MLGPIHYFYLAAFAVTAVCTLLLVRRYLEQRNTLSLAFTFVIGASTVFCLLMFGRGFFDAGSDGSILMYRAAMIATTLIPALLSIFLFYPLILERKQTGKDMLVRVVLLFIWVFAIVGMLLISVLPSTHLYAMYEFDVYSVSYGPISYTMVLAIPVLTVLIDALVIMMMVIRENEKFYKMRALLLMLGWLLVLAGELVLLVPILLILNPLLFVTGTVIMALAILRKAPT